MRGPTQRWRWLGVVVYSLFVMDAAVGSLMNLEEKESRAVALLTVALRGGGLRKCSGVAVGARAVLASAHCLDAMDESKFVEVRVPLEEQVVRSPKPSKKKAKVAFLASAKKNKQMLPSKEVPMETRFSRHFVRAPGGGAVLLRLTEPLERAWQRTVPLAVERPPLQGDARCRLHSWGLTSSMPPEARLARWHARAGNWSACWERAGPPQDPSDAAAGAGHLCALADACLAATTGAALMCQGALVGLAPPPARMLSASDDPCYGGALRLDVVAGLQDWLQKSVPDLTTAPSGLREAAGPTPATPAMTRRKRHRRGKRHSHH